MAPMPAGTGEATCSCGSGIPVQKVQIDGQAVTLVALPLIFEQFRQAGKQPRRDGRELLEAVKIYNPIPAGRRSYSEASPGGISASIALRRSRSGEPDRHL